METRNDKIDAQIELCEKKGYPHFAPYSGYCFKCNADIYSKITMKQASEHLITGCPHCNYSYCD